jgi:hypothetical protein
MNEMKMRLLVTDPQQQLPPDLLERLRDAYDVVPFRPEKGPRNARVPGPWHAAVIGLDNGAETALDLARHLKKVHPAGAVILLGPLPTDGSIREAFDVGVDVIVDAADYVDLYAAIVTRMSPRPTSSPDGEDPGPELPAGVGEPGGEVRAASAESEAP